MHSTVTAAIAAVMAELPAIAKADRAPQGWNYRGIETITAALQPLLAKHQLVIVPNAELISITPATGMKDGWHDVVLRVTWTICGPNGPTDTLTATTIGIGRDNSDKGANKAQTQAFKYLLLHLLAIGDRADDPDAADYEPGRTSQKPGRQTGIDPVMLLEQCRLLDGAAKDDLRQLAADTGNKISVQAFQQQPDWARTVLNYLEKITT